MPLYGYINAILSIFGICFVHYEEALHVIAFILVGVCCPLCEDMHVTNNIINKIVHPLEWCGSTLHFKLFLWYVCAVYQVLLLV